MQQAANQMAHVITTKYQNWRQIWGESGLEALALHPVSGLSVQWSPSNEASPWRVFSGQALLRAFSILEEAFDYGEQLHGRAQSELHR